MNLDFFIGGELLVLFGKIATLLLIVLYSIFSLIVYFQIRGLHKLVSFGDSLLSRFVTLTFFIHLLLVISLFFLALAIL